ncbi:MAG: hypothetical protein DRO87_12050, partial [Candidatus Thorarchaeota archaeon]
LAKCKKLRNLTLNNNEIKTLDVTPLFRCPNLIKLGLDDSVELTASEKVKDSKRIPVGLKAYLSRIHWF